MRRARPDLPEPAKLVALLASGQILMWTLVPSLTYSSPPLDVVESYMWGREWVLATYKHPALISWVLEASRMLTGAVGWPAYLVSQLFVATTFVFVFLLGRDLMGAERAAAGTLLLAGVAYYAWPTPEFNHNTAQLPFWAGLSLALWRAIDRRSLLWWLLVAAFAGIGLYTKLSIALLLMAAAGWLVFDPRARQSLRTPGPWICLVVFVVAIAPLALWLIAHDFAPFRYAAGRSARMHGGGVNKFAFTVLLNLAGVLAMLAVAGLIGPRSRSMRTTNPPLPSIEAKAQQYLLLLTVAPLALAIVAALLSGSNLRSAWGIPMFNLVGLLAVALTSGQFHPEALRRLAVSAAVLLIVVPLAFALVVLFRLPLMGKPLRVNWPQAEIAERMSNVWAQETHRPLRIVSGDPWIAGLVGLTAKDKPSILTKGDLTLSPWISRDRLEVEGMLIVWNGRSKKIPERLQALIASRPTREERFQWPRSLSGPDITIGYAVIAPK